MNKEVIDLDPQSNQTLDQDQELSEDMEVISPGQMLAQAREILKLSKQDIADRLNYRLALVTNIEQDNYDNSLPETFNRGYLRSYAKLVNIKENDIITSYETLNIAKIQCAEMQSFSHFTEKQAQNSRLMWVSYLIITLLIASTIIWWLQNENTTNTAVNKVVSAPAKNDINNKKVAEQISSSSQTPLVEKEPVVSKIPVETIELEADNTLLEVSSLSELNNDQINKITPIIEEQPALLATAVFTFAGDCWVNIFDATGERIAWGVKKTGYVMKITGVPPFKVTVGRPELARISFNEQEIDMSQFNVGNIAKFTLPITAN